MRAPARRWGVRSILAAAAVLSLLLGTPLGMSPARAGASLRLTDGRVLEGRDVQRDGDVYLLYLDGDSVVPIPVALVAEVGVAAAPPPPPPAPGTIEGSQVLAGVPITADTPGITVGARTLAGPEVNAPSTQEQLAVFGAPSKFQPDIVKSTLEPTYWVMDPKQANWNPSKWAEAPIDPTWHPTSAFDPNEDVLADSRSTWQKSSIDPNWVPQDGFKKSSAWP